MHAGLSERVFSGTARRVFDGEPVDSIGGRLLPEDPLAGRFERRVYDRGTLEYEAAKAAGLLESMEPTPAASEPAIAAAEMLIGAPLPQLLRRLYAEVANGGFGPGYGVLGLDGGFADDAHRTAVDILNERELGYWPGMPDGVLALCTWGCAIYSFVHCPSGRVFGWDPNPVEPDDDVPFFEQEYTIDTWLAAWLDGTLLQPWLVQDPESGAYRGATAAESAALLADPES